MFGRKAARIAALEAEVKDLRENLAVAVVPVGGITTKIEVRKGLWYRVSYLYRHNGGPILDVQNLFVGHEDLAGPYFDGTVPPEPGEQYSWKGSI